jgi:very-short-patch-repair endonuclease
VPLGPYYADFASHGARLVIEVDGSGHFTDAASTYDARRDSFLSAEGYRVLRVTTLDVLHNPDGVYATILGAVSRPES